MRKLIPLFVLLAASSNAQPREVAYELGMPEPWTHVLQVDLRIAGLSQGEREIELALPVWRSGRYQVFDFSSGIIRFEASGGSGKPLSWKKTAKSTWQVNLDGARELRVNYAVYAKEFELRTRGLDAEHAFVDGSALFMYSERYRHLPVSLKVRPYGSWHVTTGLDSIPGVRFRYHAPTYDYLIDCPLEIGEQVDHQIVIEGIPHVVSVFGPLDCDMDSLARDIGRIVRANREFWGSLPYKRYVFLFEVLPGGGGGTEHLNSAVLQVSPPARGSTRHWGELIGLISHEYFHTWNVKQLRPRGMDPYDWMKEVYFRELWLAEGGTSYFHGILLRRAGFSTPRQYLEGLALGIANDRERPGNTVESLSECSFDAWLQGRLNPEVMFNYKTDIYGRGASVCALLDLEIRNRSRNRHSLDDVLRLLLRRFPLGSGGYTVGDLKKAAAELVGGSVEDLFAAYVFGAQPIPWEQLLSHAGLRLLPVDTTQRPWLGAEVGDEGGRAVVYRVVAGSPASRAGLVNGDELLAIDGERVQAGGLRSLIQGRPLSSTVRVTYFHGAMLKGTDITLSMPAPQRYAISQDGSPTPLQRSIYESWLGASWDGAARP
jgi:predicted metalloprotease with PDZ domain